jgi:hypothetical protein
MRGARYRLIFRRARSLVLVALSLVVFIVGLARAGARYFYCTMADAVAPTECCSAHHRASSDSPDVQTPDCCEARTVDSLPSASSPRAPEAPSAPLAALAPSMSSLALDASRFVVASSRRPFVAELPRPPPSRERARLMVFLN